MSMERAHEHGRPPVMLGDPETGVIRTSGGAISDGHARRFGESGVPRSTPHDLEASRRLGTVSQDGPLPYFGELTIIRVDPSTQDWPHRCTECGRRDHAGVDCPNIERLLRGWTA